MQARSHATASPRARLRRATRHALVGGRPCVLRLLRCSAACSGKRRRPCPVSAVTAPRRRCSATGSGEPPRGTPARPVRRRVPAPQPGAGRRHAQQLPLPRRRRRSSTRSRRFDKSLADSIDYTHPPLADAVLTTKASARSSSTCSPIPTAAATRSAKLLDAIGNARTRRRRSCASPASRCCTSRTRLQQQLPHVRRLPRRGAAGRTRTRSTCRSRSSSRRRTTRSSTRCTWASCSRRRSRPPTSTRSTPRSARCSPPDELITPDDVRGTHATLEEAVLERHRVADARRLARQGALPARPGRPADALHRGPPEPEGPGDLHERHARARPTPRSSR